MDNIISVKNEHISKCSELYIKVFNAEPWNDKWTIKIAKKRLTDIYSTPNFEGILYTEDGQVKGAILGNCEQFYDGIHYNLREMFIEGSPIWLQPLRIKICETHHQRVAYLEKFSC